MLAAKIPAAVAAISQEPRSGSKTLGVLRDMLEIAAFPAYNITLDLGYYDRTLCDEDSFHFIGPGARPAVHFLRAEPWSEKWVQITESSSLKSGQRVRLVQLRQTSQQRTTDPKRIEVKREPAANRERDRASENHPATQWVYGTATHGIRAKQSATVRVRWDCDVPSDIAAKMPTESVVHSTCLFKRVLKPPAALSEKLYMDIMVALRDALPELFAAIVRVAPPHGLLYDVAAARVNVLQSDAACCV